MVPRTTDSNLKGTLFLQGFRLVQHLQSFLHWTPAPLHRHLHWLMFLHEQESLSDSLWISSHLHKNYILTLISISFSVAEERLVSFRSLAAVFITSHYSATWWSRCWLRDSADVRRLYSFGNKQNVEWLCKQCTVVLMCDQNNKKYVPC